MLIIEDKKLILGKPQFCGSTSAMLMVIRAGLVDPARDKLIGEFFPPDADAFTRIIEYTCLVSSMIPHTIPPDAMVPDLYAPSPDENKEAYFYGFGASHCRVSEAASMGVDINEYNMFGVIRHPVSRIVSAYESKKSYCEREGITEGPIVLGGNFTLERYLDNIEEQIALRSVHGASINGMGVYKGYIWEFYKPGSTLFKLENGLENGFSDYLVSIGGNI